jgi:stage V sporulation protein R
MARHGVDAVEEFIDVCLSLENLIDPMSPFIQRTRPPRNRDEEEDKAEDIPRLRAKGYMEKYINPPEFLEQQRKRIEDKKQRRKKKFPEEAQRDVLQFLVHHAPLERWQRDCLEIVRAEAYYFAPQAQTKIINEGWASYWHSKILTEKALGSSEIIDYADACAGVLATGPGRLNPYKLGLELLRNIEMRWNQGQFGKEWEECDSLAAKRDWDLRLGLGRKKVFEVRKLYNDVTFIDEFFTLEFCLEQKFYSFGFNERSGNWEIMTREFKKVKDQLLKSLTNRGQPFIYVEDGNYNNRGELLLRHSHEGADLDLGQARDTLHNLFKVWNRPVSVLTRVDGKTKLLRWDEGGFSDKSA